jgi:hypothetical protein
MRIEERQGSERGQFNVYANSQYSPDCTLSLQGLIDLHAEIGRVILAELAKHLPTPGEPR